MAKGVRKIKWSPEDGDAEVYPNLSIPNRKLTIEPDKFAWFEISEWESGTTEEDKKKQITWIRQSQNRKEVFSYTLTASTQKYGVKIPRKLCGSFSYYIEASLFGKRDFRIETGLQVSGYCPERIISSKWSTTNDGNDVRSQQFKYGQLIHLGLNTEGLNGSKTLIVEVYKYNEGSYVTGRKADTLVFTYTSVEVTDGEVNLKMGNTINWFVHAKEEVEKFYIKIKNHRGEYIIDPNNDDKHARFLRIKKEIVTKPIEPSTNNTPLKVGKADVNVKNYHNCKFKEISITDYPEEPLVIFNEGTAFLKKQATNVRYESQEVYFDFDKHTIRNTETTVLDSLSTFLVANEHLTVSLSGHADDRGTLDYNQNLSEKRADSVRLYLFKKGLDDTKFVIRGYGEVKPKSKGTSEESYQQNRRVVVEFSYVEYNAPVMVYETIAPTHQIRKKLNLKISERKNEQCFRDGKEKHTKEILIKENTNLGKNEFTQSSDNFSNEVYSIIGSDFKEKYLWYLLKYLNPVGTIYNSYLFHINTCGYFANKDTPTLQIKAYPDVVWIGHFQYNYANSGDYFFHDKNLQLENGIENVVNEFKNSIFYDLLSIIPGGFVFKEVLLPYIVKQAKDFNYAIHTIHNRELEKKGQELSLTGTLTNIITETKYTKYAAAAVIFYFVILGIVIDLIMIYLTRGKNLQGRIAKLATKVKQVKTFLDKTGLEIVPPSLALNAGMYYKKQNDGRLALIYEANLNANPIVALNFEKEFDLVKILTEKLAPAKGEKPVNKKLEENKKWVLAALKESGIEELKGSFTALGEWAMELKVKYNFLTQSYAIIDQLGNFVDNSKAEVICKEQITIKVFISGKYKNDFKFFGIKTNIKGEFDLKLNGAAALKTNFQVSKDEGLSMKKTLIFSGIKGTFTGRIKATNDILGTLFDFGTDEKKPIEFTLIDPHEIDLGTIQFFNQNK
ncbi:MULTISPECIES: OmpA family protein [Flavobacterium]|uniref:OmpA family protein n=1 Tax=Flavobacterium jumunjinense TaxID=998845 RepID=A0ABV5GM91_9FLAO|nr:MULTISPECIES: OmpA family protein [Flavobacterium]